MEDGRMVGSITRIVPDTYYFKWFISNPRVLEYRESIKSPTFTTGANNEHNWHFEFHENCFLDLHFEDFEDEDVCVSVKVSHLLEKEGMDDNITVLQTQLGKKYCSNETVSRFTTLIDTYSEEYMNWSQLPFTELTIFFEIIYEPIELLKFEDRYLLNDLKLILQNGEHSDVTIIVGEKKFHVHKFMLVLRCPVFATMFAHDMVENQRKAVEITDIDHDTMGRLLEYIYTDRVDNIEESTERLFSAADKYALEGLKCLCSKVLIERISEENVCDMLKLADKYSADDLKTGVLDYVLIHGKVVIEMLERSSEMDLPLFSLKQILELL